MEINEEGLLLAIRQPVAGEINWNEFMALGFSHHMEILAKAKDRGERLFYIHECAIRAWDKYTLRSQGNQGIQRITTFLIL